MHLKRLFSAMCLCHVKSFKASRAETPGSQLFRRFKCITNKKYSEIYYINYIEMRRKIIDDCRL